MNNIYCGVCGTKIANGPDRELAGEAKYGAGAFLCPTHAMGWWDGNCDLVIRYDDHTGGILVEQNEAKQ